MKIKVEYESIWEEGSVSTSAKLDTVTGEITNIGVSDDVDHLETLINQVINYGGESYLVDDEEGYFLAEGELKRFNLLNPELVKTPTAKKMKK